MRRELHVADNRNEVVGMGSETIPSIDLPRAVLCGLSNRTRQHTWFSPANVHDCAAKRHKHSSSISPSVASQTQNGV